MEIPLDVGPGLIRSYRRLSYRTWYALAEFIDNTTQNYTEHREELATAGDIPPLTINIDYDKEHLRIADNAMGMNLEELTEALKLGQPPKNTSGRSEYGLGMKTAACWFGDYWTITTKRFGDEHEYEVVIDVDKVAAGNVVLPTRVTKKPREKHHTIIDIKKLHRKYHHTTKRRIETYIRSMYRVDLEEANLWITINGDDPLTPDARLQYLKDLQQNEYLRPFDTTINGKLVRGKVGILNPGSRREAGFAIIRRGRGVRAQPDAWRPETIFGIQRNNLLNQRLVGELHLDGFGISHTKDQILWEQDEEHDLEKYLADNFKDFIAVARRPRKDDHTTSGPSQAEILLGASELRQQMESPEFADLIELQEVLPEELVKEANAPLIEAAKSEDPLQVVRIGKGDVEIVCKIHLNHGASRNDPYFAADYASGILLSVNTQHPHFKRIRGGAHGVMTYLMECVYDAIAEWKAMSKNTVRHDTIKILKDGLLRFELAMDIEDEQAEDAPTD